MKLTIRLAERHTACPDLLRGSLDRRGCDSAKVKAGVKTNVDRNRICYFEGPEFYPTEEDLARSERISDVEQSGALEILLLNNSPVAASGKNESKRSTGAVVPKAFHPDL